MYPITKQEFISRIQSEYVKDKDCAEMWAHYCGEKYNYEEAVKEDVMEYINNEIDLEDYSTREELEEYLNEHLWTVDAVTGNGSGSYTFNTWRAEENLCHNLDLLGDALQEFGCDNDYLVKHGAEACDVTIRCYLLGQAISAALDKVWEDPEDDDEEDEEGDSK